jgi:hypothetical protein
MCFLFPVQSEIYLKYLNYLEAVGAFSCVNQKYLDKRGTNIEYCKTPTKEQGNKVKYKSDQIIQPGCQD